MAALVVTGAYGRTANLQDWQDGKDFQVYPRGVYFSKRDIKLLKQDGYKTIEFYDLKSGIEVFTVEL